MLISKKMIKIYLSALLLALSGLVAADGQISKKINELPWVYSGTATMAEQATIKITPDLRYLDSPGTEQFLSLNGNFASPNEYTIQSKKHGWFAIFSFVDSGYVKDDEKIDADALLQELKSQNVSNLELRKEQKLPLLYLDGWYIPPRYDQQSNRLEWATKIHDENNQIIINFTTRILGRKGYMSATLVSDPASLDRDIAEFKNALRNYEFQPGQKYAEFRDGDKMAAYGLGALVLGGAAAAASKGGFKALWALILAAGAAVVAFIKKIFGKK